MKQTILSGLLNITNVLTVFYSLAFYYLYIVTFSQVNKCFFMHPIHLLFAFAPAFLPGDKSIFHINLLSSFKLIISKLLRTSTYASESRSTYSNRVKNLQCV